MWLDRLAHPGTASSQSSSRAVSPLPRRLSGARGPYVTSQRSARGSALSLVSNDSSTSLLASARKPNGSALRQSTVVATDGREADEVLSQLLGSLSADASPVEKRAVSSITEDDFTLDFDFGGLSLRQLAQAGTGWDGLDVPHSQTVEECTCPFL